MALHCVKAGGLEALPILSRLQLRGPKNIIFSLKELSNSNGSSQPLAPIPSSHLLKLKRGYGHTIPLVGLFWVQEKRLKQHALD